ncbi:MAG: Ala-tRNA(Pro) deacylase [Cocleimonas sp.]|jgi:Ala-tRNA(Pro) deacylase
MAHSDRPNPDTLILDNGDLAATADQVIASIETLGFEQETETHEPLYTVEQSKQVASKKPVAHTKNLFLRNKKGRMFLFVVEQDSTIDLKGLRDKLQLTGGHLAFASIERMEKFLGVVPGSVSPLAVINDHSGKVQVYIERDLLEQEWIYMHPGRNTQTTRLRCDDLLKLLISWEHPATLLDF